MKNLILIGLVLLFGSNVALSDPQFWVKGKCYPTYPFGYVVSQKLDNTHYGAAVSQTNYCLMISCYAIIEMADFNPAIRGPLNRQVEYIETRTMKLDNGFDANVDILKECK